MKKTHKQLLNISKNLKKELGREPKGIDIFLKIISKALNKGKITKMNVLPVAPINIEDDIKLANLMNKLAKTIIHAKYQFEYYKDIKLNIPKHMNALNKFPYFWRYTHSALRSAAIGEICRAYDHYNSGDKETLSLINLLKTITRTKHLSKKLEGEIKQIIDPTNNGKDIIYKLDNQIYLDIKYLESNEVVAKLKLIRNSQFAHNEITGNTLHLDDKNIEELINKALEIINRYMIVAIQYREDLVTYSDKLLYHNDISSLLELTDK